MLILCKSVGLVLKGTQLKRYTQSEKKKKASVTLGKGLDDKPVYQCPSKHQQGGAIQMLLKTSFKNAGLDGI